MRPGRGWLIVSGAGLALLAAGALLVPALSPYGRDAIDLGTGATGPSLVHPFGTDELGRGLLTRVAAGGRISFGVAAAVALLTTLAALVVGTISGYRKGVPGTLLMRFTDFFLALPTILVLMLAGSLFGGGNLLGIVLVLAAFGWMQPARAIRSHIEGISKSAYVEAARDMGAGTWWVIRRHLLPATGGLAAAIFSLAFANAMIAESTISFLGFGIQPPTPSLGSMLRSTVTAAIDHPWLAVFPGLAVTLAVLWSNGLAEALQRRADPTAQREAGKAARRLSGRTSPGLEAVSISEGSPSDRLLTVRDLSVTGPRRPIIDRAQLDIIPGEILALVGRSGAGKTSIALAIAGLLPQWLAADGLLCVDGAAAADLMRNWRGRHVGMIFQDPYASFVPTRPIGWHFRQALRRHFSLTRSQSAERACEWLLRAGVADPIAAIPRLPGSFSGGELQRISIALALCLEPKLLIADEPTSSLDLASATALLDLLAHLRDETGTAVLLITHDLGMVIERADRVAVVAHGRVSPVMPVSRGEGNSPGRTALDELSSAGAGDLVEAARMLR